MRSGSMLSERDFERVRQPGGARRTILYDSSRDLVLRSWLRRLTHVVCTLYGWWRTTKDGTF